MAYPEQSFIEVQFPVSKVSKESYKERKANLGQTLTGLGKWWGRKPLILIRAALLGLLMPVGSNPKMDRDIFLKILTMDEEGLWLRKNKPISVQVIYDNLTPGERKKVF
jgi:putative DNA methylase